MNVSQLRFVYNVAQPALMFVDQTVSRMESTNAADKTVSGMESTSAAVEEGKSGIEDDKYEAPDQSRPTGFKAPIPYYNSFSYNSGSSSVAQSLSGSSSSLSMAQS
jgi:hypothetical protein